MPGKPLSELYSEVAALWVDADAAATILEETKSAYFSQKVQSHALLPVNRAEHIVKASQDWRDYITNMVEARKTANHLKVKCDVIRMRSAEEQSAQATARAEMRI